MSALTILLFAFIQNIAFSLVSRARNRDQMLWHATTSVLSNGIWFVTMRELVIAELSFTLLAPYIVGTVAGSLFGARISMRIEKALNSQT